MFIKNQLVFWCLISFSVLFCGGWVFLWLYLVTPDFPFYGMYGLGAISLISSVIYGVFLFYFLKQKLNTSMMFLMNVFQAYVYFTLPLSMLFLTITVTNTFILILTCVIAGYFGNMFYQSFKKRWKEVESELANIRNNIAVKATITPEEKVKKIARHFSLSTIESIDLYDTVFSELSLLEQVNSKIGLNKSRLDSDSLSQKAKKFILKSSIGYRLAFYSPLYIFVCTLETLVSVGLMLFLIRAFQVYVGVVWASFMSVSFGIIFYYFSSFISAYLFAKRVEKRADYFAACFSDKAEVEAAIDFLERRASFEKNIRSLHYYNYTLDLNLKIPRYPNSRRRADYLKKLYQ